MQFRSVRTATDRHPLLVLRPVNIRYLTGCDVETGALLLTSKQSMLFVDGRYREGVMKEKRRGIRVRSIDTLPHELRRLKHCAFERDSVTIAQLSSLKKHSPKVRFFGVTKIVENLRRVKTEAEQRVMKKALTITNRMLAHLPLLLKPGITERALAWKLETLAHEEGCEGLSFPAIVAFGPNTSRPHHHPTQRKLRPHDIVQIDVGVRYRGYCSDRSEVFFVGEPTRKMQEVNSAVALARDTARAMVHAGVSVRSIDCAARSVLRRYKLERYFCHSLGHGVGLEVHEGVSISRRLPPSVTLNLGEVVTIEPGVYIPGKFGIRLEDMVWVRERKTGGQKGRRAEGQEGRR